MKRGRKPAWTNEFDRRRRIAFLRMRAQAEFRNEHWMLTWQDFCDFWHSEDLFSMRGRDHDSLILSRKDPYGPWALWNCHIKPRKDHVSHWGNIKNNMMEINDED